MEEARAAGGREQKSCVKGSADTDVVISVP
jgi:hypothetical protein